MPPSHCHCCQLQSCLNISSSLSLLSSVTSQAPSDLNYESMTDIPNMMHQLPAIERLATSVTIMCACLDPYACHYCDV